MNTEAPGSSVGRAPRRNRGGRRFESSPSDIFFSGAAQRRESL